MVVVVTVLAAFLAYHVNWIRQSHEVLAKAAVVYIDWDDGDDPSDAIEGPVFDPGPRRAPWPLCLFGEQGYYGIQLAVEDRIRKPTPEEVQKCKRAGRLFPEARFVHPW